MTATRPASASRLARALFVVALVVCASPAGAQEVVDSDAAHPGAVRLRRGFAALARPYGIIEGGVGILTLPAAEVCRERSTGCKQGDLSFSAEAWPLYRANVRWAFGGGLVLGLIPTAHPPHEDPEGIERDQTRSYLTVEGTSRYYPFVADTFEWWVGVTGGLVVVNDRFQVVMERDDRALLGPRGVTIRTEGGTIGFGTGFAYELARHWAFTGTARYAQWFLPTEPARDPLGSEASLRGANVVLSVAFGVAYRVAL